MYANEAKSCGSLAQGIVGAPKPQTVTEQLRDCRNSLEGLLSRMDDLINKTGVNVVNEILGSKAQECAPQRSDTSGVAIDLTVLAGRLHSKMETLERIA